MMLLDTNTCVHILKDSDAALVARFSREDAGRLSICSVVKSELIYGAWHSQRVEANLQALERFWNPIASLPFDDRCAEVAGRIRADLRAKGTPIGANDLLIAATALAHEAVLVTHNTREFARVSGLRLEDWECL
ncbi:MAG: type II toxin-antitoxin system VapC family toxin [Candidatus Hydrogenedentes bacterium]|nr:type II toxin-antitoxin system VapC family toxin [Candidatus Hydrogenedentota bacterium]